jgi:hypothetical protein
MKKRRRTRKAALIQVGTHTFVMIKNFVYSNYSKNVDTTELIEITEQITSEDKLIGWSLGVYAVLSE